MMFGENVAKMKRGTVDRISELPEFILHNILSMLDTKEAGRASVLSKRWYDVWSSIPVLDFQLQHFDTDTIQGFLGFIDRTMQRYFTHKYRIMKLNLEIPMVNEKTELLVDKWLKIAVQNQIEEFQFKVRDPHSPDYQLPDILFRAKSLKVMICENAVMPYYETMELISLECLLLIVKNVDMDMFQRIITFCPLVDLDITIEGIGKLSLPWTRKVNEGTEFVDSGIMQSNFKASPLRKFAYHGLSRCITWPWNMNVVVLKNLRKLEIVCATITDDIVFEMAHGLVALERLLLATCIGLKCIKVSSISLKDLAIVECVDLIEVTVDAPNLLEFWYNCELETPLSLTRLLDHCNAQFFPLFVLDSITTVWLVKLKKFLLETDSFKSLLIELSHGLVALERLLLATCIGLKCIKVSSISLKDLAIVECVDLIEVTVDAPNLLEFWYNCELETPLSLTRLLDHCNAQFFPLFVLDSITTVWLVKLKKFLLETDSFKSLLIELSHGLVALERLLLATCIGLKCIKVSSISLKDLAIVECVDLIEVTVDAPNLLEFWYNCELETPLSLTRLLDHCNAQFFPLFVLDSITTVWLVKLKKFLLETDSFKSLLIELSRSLEFEIEEEQLRNMVTGPSYKLKELKLRELSAWDYTESLTGVTAFLDGLFWCCHPDILSITSSHNLTAKAIFNILKRKVQCYKHPLRSIEIECVDSSSFLSEPSELEIRFRLSWF